MNVTYLLERRKSLWYGTKTDGLYRIDLERGISHFEGNVLNIKCLLATHTEDKPWCGTGNEGILIFRDGQWRSLKSAGTSPGNDIRALLQGVDQSVYCGTSQGVSKLDNGIWQERLDDLNDLPSAKINCLLMEGNELWCGTDKGLASVIGGIVHAESSLQGQDIRCLFKDRIGALWCGTNSGLWRRDRQAWYNVWGWQVQCLLEDHAGVLWCATDNGLYAGVESPKKVLGLDASVQCLLEDWQGILWCGTTAGILTIDGLQAISLPETLEKLNCKKSPKPLDAEEKPPEKKVLPPQESINSESPIPTPPEEEKKPSINPEPTNCPPKPLFPNGDDQKPILNVYGLTGVIFLLLVSGFTFFSPRLNSSAPSVQSQAKRPDLIPTKSFVLSTYKSKETEFTEKDALNLLSQWQRIKAQAYQAPYDESALETVLSGVMLRGSSGEGGRIGSVRWLRNNSSYWRFSNQNQNRVLPGTLKRISATKMSTVIDSEEHGQLYNQYGRSDPKTSFTNLRGIKFYFEKLDKGNGEHWYIVQCFGTAACDRDPKM